MEQPNLSLSPAVVTPKTVKVLRLSDGNVSGVLAQPISYCQSGEIRNVLEATGVNDLMSEIRVEYMKAPESHQQRKFYPLRDCVEFHLKIPNKVIKKLLL